MSSPTSPLAPVAVAAEQTKAKSLLDEIVAEGRFSPDAESQARGRDMIETYVREAVDGHLALSADAEATITKRLGQIDQIISKQINEVMHDPAFQKLEASWRGLRYLMDQSETNAMLKIKVLNVSKKDLLRDLQRAPEFDQSSLYQKVYRDEFGSLGGVPYGALIGDYEFDRGNEDMDLMQRVAQVASAAHAPFISAASPKLLNLKSFTDLGAPRDMSKVFDSPEYTKWKSFRDSEDSRYVALTLPHVLMRDPYDPESKPIDAFDYKEDVDGKDHSKYLWGNAAYALGARITDSFAKYGWCAAIRGVNGGGKVEGLTVHNFLTDEGDVALKCPTEVSIPDSRENELSEQGFISLVHYKGTDNAVFIGGQTVNKPIKYTTDEATANAKLSSQLPYMLAMARFAHYIKCILRDEIGGTKSRSQIESDLKTWILGYVIDSDDASPADKAKFPLRKAEIEVTTVPGDAGALRAVAFLRPHFQLDKISVSLRLVAELPKKAS